MAKRKASDPAQTDAAAVPPTAAKKRKKVSKPKRAPGAALLAPLVYSEALQAIVGKKPLSRSKMTVKVWEYIKEQGCQDQKDRRMINPSGLLVPVLGAEPVSMFELTRLVNKHVVGKAE